ncbi:hypothetical protein NT239_01155 [Chitinibacter sp. SCUT-21]|uniref:hypothetical protein n=1 Tax=Chitinibacter sp. SCUT-21 TaxID=2970891 RepID=UPI0035A726B6
MSMNAEQVKVAIAKLLDQLKPEQLEELYNQLHAEDHIVYVGKGVYEHQDMDD